MTMAACRRLLRALAYGLFVSSCLIMLFFYATDMSHMMKARRMQQRQEWRKQLINKTCRSNNKRFLEELSPRLLSNFIVDDAHGLIYCYIPKVGCTNMKKIMVTLKDGPPYGDPRILDGTVHESEKLTFLMNYPRHEIKAKLKHYTKFMFVRDPFIRLISAYRDKFEAPNPFFYQRHSRVMLRLYGNHLYPPLTVETAFASGLRVSFSNLIQYILDPRTVQVSGDEHWNQMNNLCHPCFIKYDFIGNQETMDEDIEYLLEMLNLKNDIKVPPSFKNQTTRDSMKKWYKAVPLAAKKKLYNHYEIDYKLFGYKRPNDLLKG